MNLPVPGTGRRRARGEVAALLVAAERAGARVERGGKHWKVWAPGARRPLTLPVSASDWRALRNARASLKRAGLL